MYLIELSKIGKAIVEDDGVYAVPEFREVITTKGMGEPAFRTIALIHDYQTPFRHRAVEERHVFVTRDVYGRDAKRTIDLNNPLIVAAVAKYKILQYDMYREELESTKSILQKTINLKNAIKVEEGNLTQIGALITRIEKFEKRIEELKNKIEENSGDGPVKEKISLYRLEKKYQEEQSLNNN